MRIGATLAVMLATTGLGAQTAPGTYRVFLCPAVCRVADSSSAVASLVVVIAGDSAALPADTQRALNGFYYKLGAGTPNACFAVVSHAARVGSEELFVGIIPVAATRVRRDDQGVVTLSLYGSPDAFYWLSWPADRPFETGEGWSTGPFINIREHGNAFFAAVRVGEGDVTKCVAPW